MCICIASVQIIQIIIIMIIIIIIIIIIKTYKKILCHEDQQDRTLSTCMYR